MKPELVKEERVQELWEADHGLMPWLDKGSYTEGFQAALHDLGIVLVVEFSPDLVHMDSHLDNYCVDLEEGPVLLKAKEG